MELQHNRSVIEGVLAELKAAPPDACFPAPARLPRNFGMEPCFIVAGAKMPVRAWLASAMKLERPSPDHEIIASCGKHSCINPRHVMWSFQPANVLEFVAERTAVVSPKVHGRRQRTREIYAIPDNEIAEIRWLLHNNYPAKYVAEAFNAPVTSVLRILHGKRSAHVKPKPVDMDTPIHTYTIAPLRTDVNDLSEADVALARKLRWDDNMTPIDVARTVRTTPTIAAAVTSRYHRNRLYPHLKVSLNGAPTNTPKLSDDDVVALRRDARSTPRFTWTDAARKHGVSVSTVRKAIGGSAYRHIDHIEQPVFKALSPKDRTAEMVRRGMVDA